MGLEEFSDTGLLGVLIGDAQVDGHRTEADLASWRSISTAPTKVSWSGTTVRSTR
jgi:hypothetical protein